MSISTRFSLERQIIGLPPDSNSTGLCPRTISFAPQRVASCWVMSEIGDISPTECNLPDMDCPNCKLVNPPNCMRCDCGYDFQTYTIQH